ncbi:MAG: hypothetical protein PHU34_06740 [Candidatus Methanoperedens sp.]|nr:hypothetical protein [Candidatus Methanoperedens sp.]
MTLTLFETILLILDVILLIVAIFLFIRLRKSGKKSEPEKKQELSPSQTDILPPQDLTPLEFKPERFNLMPEDIVAPINPSADVSMEPKLEFHEQTGLMLEDEPIRKEAAGKKKVAKKEPKKSIVSPVKVKTSPAVKPVITEAKEEKPAKKKAKKEKPAKKEPEKSIVSPVKVKTSPAVKPAITETKEEKPAKKVAKKKKATKQK